MLRNKVVLVLASAVAAVLVLVAGGVWWIRSQQNEAVVFAREATNALLESWDPEALLTRASETLLRNNSEAQTRSFVAFLNDRLARVKTIRTVRRADSAVHVGARGPVLMVRVRVDCDFEKGEGSLSWLLVKDGPKWKVDELTATSDRIP